MGARGRRAVHEAGSRAEGAVRDALGPTARALYTPEHVERGFEDEGLPGEFPFLRGPYPTMYRARPWTIRQIAGYGEPADTNRRLRYLIEHGQTGISVDFDMPTLMGFDSDDERSYGEVGREGVAIDHVDDLHRVFEGIDVGQVSVSMTINPTAWILLAMFLVVAEEREIAWEGLSGTTQADIVKEFIAQKEWIYPVDASLRLVRDMITFGAERLPRWNPGHDQRLPRARGRARPRCRRSPSRSRRRSPTPRRSCATGMRFDRSRPASPSTSSRTPTSSRRWPSSGPPAACGRGSLASVSGRRRRSRCAFASTARRRAPR